MDADANANANANTNANANANANADAVGSSIALREHCSGELKIVVISNQTEILTIIKPVGVVNSWSRQQKQT